MEIISFSGAISKIETTSDRGLKFTWYTQELPSQDMTTFFSFSWKQVFFCMWENPINEMPENLWKSLTEKPSKWKTPAQRVRNALYMLWDYDNHWYDNFEKFYVYRMDKIEHWILEKVNI